MNGWSNKETWLVNLWLGDTLSELADEGFTVDAAFIEQHVDEYFDDLKSIPKEDQFGLVSDLINCAKNKINYWELGEHYHDDTQTL
jgi:hypothetical protein